MMFDTINWEVRNGVGWITLNRPEKLNAFTTRMNQEILYCLKEVNRDSAIRCLVITGAGRAFSAGEDLSGLASNKDPGEILQNRYNPMMIALAALEKPVVAAVNGVAAGSGFSLALGCDFRIAAVKSSFVASFIHVGLVPDSGQLFYLPRIVGHAKAIEIAMLGEKVSAQQAFELGIVTEVVEDELLESKAAAFAERLAALPTKTIGLIKRHLEVSLYTPLSDMLEREAEAQAMAGMTQDHKEGVTAFLEKRKPVFTGN